MSSHIYHLTLEWKLGDPGSEYDDCYTLEAQLDGVSLLALVRDWELQHVPEGEKDIAGAYAGLQTMNAPTLYKWLSEPVPGFYGWSTERKVCLVGCSCGVLDCWPLEAEVTVTETQVTWSGFQQPFRRESWSYEGFGPFTFKRTQYEAEVRRALANVPRPDNG